MSYTEISCKISDEYFEKIHNGIIGLVEYSNCGKDGNTIHQGRGNSVYKNIDYKYSTSSPVYIPVSKIVYLKDVTEILDFHEHSDLPYEIDIKTFIRTGKTEFFYWSIMLENCSNEIIVRSKESLLYLLEKDKLKD
jgi:hypothetical protein